MKSRPTLKGASELRQLSDNAKADIQHVFNNGFMIVRGLAEQLLTNDDEGVRHRARTIVRTIDELVEQERFMFGKVEPLNRHPKDQGQASCERIGRDDHLGSVGE